MSTTSQSFRGRCVALIAVTAGITWLTTSPAMAGNSSVNDPCAPYGQAATTGLGSLAPATGILSITDAAGAAAGQGMRSLPGRPAVSAPAGARVGGASGGISAMPARSAAGALGPSALQSEPNPVAPLLAVLPGHPSLADALCLPVTTGVPSSSTLNRPTLDRRPGRQAGARAKDAAARGERKATGSRHRPARHNAGKTVTRASQGDLLAGAPAGRKVQRERKTYPKIYPKALAPKVSTPSDLGDLAAPALARGTSGGMLADLAGATGRALLP